MTDPERQSWLRDEIARCAEEIRSLFPSDAEAVVTVIVRTPGTPPGKGDVLVTAETDIAPALACAQRLFEETEPLG